WTPKEPVPEVVLVPRVAPRVSSDESRALGDRIRQLYADATEPVRFDQAVSLDLDADGTKDRLLVATVPASAAASQPAPEAPDASAETPAPPSAALEAGALAYSGVVVTYATAPSDLVM